MITLTVETNDQDAYVLALLLKRLTFSAVRECARDEAEAYSMLSGIYAVQKALAEQGYNPR